jgi:5'-3' exonuclease
MSYILVDTANTFFRARHVTRGDTSDKVGMSLHVVLNSVRKAWRDFDGKHVIFCLEGRSWRKDHYEPYKRNRSDARAVATPREQEEDRVFWETFDNFKDFIAEKTNCTVLQHDQLEADDLIAGWIASHPNDEHVIISTDGDFAQLIAPNVKQYNGVTGITITHEGFFDDKGKRVVDKKTKEVKPAPDPEWLLFEKCMRGDTSDNVFSAFPGVREKGTKNKVGLREAFADRHSKGWAWNNLMLQRWVDHEGTEHRVLEDYTRNKLLCDLTAQPDDIKLIIKETINQSIGLNKNISQVGIRLLKFCASYDLVKVSEQAQSYSEPLNARYINEHDRKSIGTQQSLDLGR